MSDGDFSEVLSTPSFESRFMNSLHNKSPLVWFITGTSQGFGHELVRVTLARGDHVIATSRQPEKVAAAFPGREDRLLTLALDFSDSAGISHAVDTAIKRFGRIDVLANNAGHGLLGAVEEASDAEIERVYETNVFGLLRLTRAVLPQLRKQRSGHIVNLSSIGGLVGLPGWGIYCSTKFAVEGISEALATELAPLGIGVTVVEPGPFRTDFLGSSLTMAEKVVADYESTAGQTRNAAPERNRNQPGSPGLAAEAIVKAVTSPRPPLHLPLGAFALDRASQKFEQILKEFSEWRDVAVAADFKD
jgi:NAD(P)-dependent dehydrogenase (short-subunit alcohol dehydrogenase family)